MAEPKGRRKRASKRAGETEQRNELTAEREVTLSTQGDALPLRVAREDGAVSEDQVRRRAYELYVSRGGGKSEGGRRRRSEIAAGPISRAAPGSFRMSRSGRRSPPANPAGRDADCR